MSKLSLISYIFLRIDSRLLFADLLPVSVTLFCATGVSSPSRLVLDWATQNQRHQQQLAATQHHLPLLLIILCIMHAPHAELASPTRLLPSDQVPHPRGYTAWKS